MLRLYEQSLYVLLIQQWTCLCLGLCGIAVGMGARVPNLREVSPAKIASGFGGTLTLVMSVAFISSAITCTAIPTCFWLSRAGSSPPNDLATWDSFSGLGSDRAVILSVLAIGGLAVAATVISLASGRRTFERPER